MIIPRTQRTPATRTPAAKPHIPERLGEVILTHVVRNLQDLPGPVLLGLDGAPGTGKTFAVTEVLTNAHVFRVSLSGADLESVEAGRPAALIRRAYLKAAATIAAGKAAAVVFDDLDATLGRWDENTTYTVNNQLTVTELMHLADSPTRVDGRTVRRVPIILTGNHLGRLYPPLRRPGRMQIHRWELNPGELLEVVQGVFHGLDPDIPFRLLGKFPNQPVAFFADLRRRAEEHAIRTAVLGLNPAEAVRRALEGKLPSENWGRITTAGLIALGEQLAAELSVRNRLEG